MTATVSSFEHLAATLRLTKEGTARAWELLRELRIGPDDPEAVRVLLHVSLGEDTARIKQATGGLLNEAKATVASAAKETAGNLEGSAARIEKAAIAKMMAQQAELTASLTEDIAQAANKAMGKRADILSRNTLAAWLATSLLASAALGYTGYRVGMANTSAASAELSTMLQREDGAAWRQLIGVNNGAAALATNCRAGGPNVRRVDGGTICTLPLWLQHDGVVSAVPGRTIESGALLASITGWVASWGPWWLLAVGAVATLLVRKVVNQVSSWGPMRWLFDLPV